MVKPVRYGDRMIEGDVAKCLWVSCVHDWIDLSAINEIERGGSID